MSNDDGYSAAGDKWENSGFTVRSDSGGLRTRSIRDRVNNILSEKQSLQDLEEARNPELADVSYGHWEAFAQTVTGIAENGVRNRSIVPVEAVTLEELINPALSVLKEVMDVRLDESDPNFTKILSSKKDAAVSIINAVLKADENRFRQRKSNVLEELLARMNKLKDPMRIEILS